MRILRKLFTKREEAKIAQLKKENEGLALRVEDLTKIVKTWVAKAYKYDSDRRKAQLQAQNLAKELKETRKQVASGALYRTAWDELTRSVYTVAKALEEGVSVKQYRMNCSVGFNEIVMQKLTDQLESV